MQAEEVSSDARKNAGQRCVPVQRDCEGVYQGQGTGWRGGARTRELRVEQRLRAGCGTASATSGSRARVRWQADSSRKSVPGTANT